jgi:CheY-like chemotaxis protein
MCETHRPDVAILDIAMPRLNGIDVAERAIKHQPQLKVVFLSMYADESYCAAGALCGCARVPAEGIDRTGSAAGAAHDQPGASVLQPDDLGDAARPTTCGICSSADRRTRIGC